ncbi:hypothetical protein Tco_1491942 [Tanacetum coccineum]
MSTPATAEEKTKKKNDVKARGLLLMAFPNEHQLTFSQYPDAKSMFAAMETRFGCNAATKKTLKTLLKQQYENFSATSAEFLDSIFNRLQKIVSRLAILGKPVRKSVRYAEMYRSQRPRGNQRNWNGQKSNQLGKDASIVGGTCGWGFNLLNTSRQWNFLVLRFGVILVLCRIGAAGEARTNHLKEGSDDRKAEVPQDEAEMMRVYPTPSIDPLAMCGYKEERIIKTYQCSGKRLNYISWYVYGVSESLYQNHREVCVFLHDAFKTRERSIVNILDDVEMPVEAKVDGKDE